MFFPRSSGILLHPTSLPSRGAIGDFGTAAYSFLDFLAAARQTLWQILPLGPTGMGNSPYSSTSAFAGNPLLISLERLAEHGWMNRESLKDLLTTDSVDYESARATKLPLLRQAAKRFLEQDQRDHRARFNHFRQDNHWWLDDFALFNVLRQRYAGATWSRWPRELARRDPGAMEKVRKELARKIEIECAIQFAFFEQWRALRAACHARGIRIVGDVAIFVSYDSADVWTHPEIFHLDSDLQPYVVAGVPPDAFSDTGQRWGNPLYRWDVLKSRGYDWWVQRMRWALQCCDIIRLDHFRGFEQCWEIPASEPTAVHGRWVAGPADDLFHALRNALGELPLIAEDLGFITPEVHALRERLQIPGMRVMQFGFGDPGAHIYLPHRFEPNTVVYTGTHDNDTTVGWWKHCATEAERSAASAYLSPANEDGIHWAFIRAAETSIAELCILPLQDVLGLGSETRMNIPSRAGGNWTWRFKADTLTGEIAKELAALVSVTDRDHPLSAGGQQSDGKISEDFAA